MTGSEGLGVGPRTAPRRAAVVNKVTRDPAVRGRPLLWCLSAGTIAVASFLLILVALFQEIPRAGGGDLRPALLLFAPVCAISTWAFCYGWELGDAGKATRLWLILVFGAVAIVIVVALVLLVLAASKSDADLDLDIDLGGIIGSFGEVVGDAGSEVMGSIGEAGTDLLADMHGGQVPTEPVLDEAGATAATAAVGATLPGVTPLPPGDPRGLDCPACGFRFDGAAHVACPSCGRPV